MKNILVLTDFSENAKKAENYALQLAIRLKDNLVLYNTYPRRVAPSSDNLVWPHDAPASLKLQSIANLESGMARLRGKLSKIKDESHKPSITFIAIAGTITHQLNDIIKQNNVSVIVMGTKGESFTNNLLYGSNVFRVLDKVNCPVFIIPQNAKFKDLDKMVYATDLKSFDLNVIDWLNTFSKRLKVKLMMAHVCSNNLPGGAEENLLKLTEQIYQSKLPGSQIVSFLSTDVSQALRELAKQTEANMFVLLHRKQAFGQKLFHASIAHKMIKETRLPVLVFAD